MLAISLASGGVVATPPGFRLFAHDKLLHLLVFGLLATAWFRAMSSSWRTLARSVAAIAVTAAFGAFDEVHQSFTPGRFMEFDDWLADCAGAILAVVVYQCWPGYRALLEMRVGRKALRGKGGAEG